MHILMHTQECTSEYNFWRRNLIVLSNSTRIRDTAAFSLTSFHIYVTSTLQNFCWPWNNFHSNSEGKKWPLRAENNHWPFLPVPSGSGDGFFFFYFMLLLSPISLGMLAFPASLSHRIFVFQITFPRHSSFCFPVVEFNFISCPDFNLSKSKKNDFSVFAGQGSTFQFSIFCEFNYLCVYMARYRFNSIGCRSVISFC